MIGRLQTATAAAVVGMIPPVARLAEQPGPGRMRGCNDALAQA
jgi:hypothetical protein